MLKTSRKKYRDRIHFKQKLSHLAQCAKHSADILGVKSIKLLDYPDNRMDSVDLLDVVKTIEEYIEILKPDVLVTHHACDLNIDHQTTHQASVTACRPHPNQNVKRILTFEVPSSTEWQSASLKNSFVPNWFEDISDTLEMKMKALEAYKSEMQKWPHARSNNAIEHLAKWRGASVGYEAVESFMLIREIR